MTVRARIQSCLYVSIALGLLSSPLVNAGDNESKKSIQAIEDCLNGKDVTSEVCKKTNDYLAKHKLQREGDAIFLEEEAQVRDALKAKGLALPLGIIPVAFSAMTVSGNEAIAVLDWSYGLYEEDGAIADRRQQAEWLSYKMELFPLRSYWDGGSYNKIHFYVKPKNTKSYTYSNSSFITGEFLTKEIDSKNPKMSLNYWFKDVPKPDCDSTAEKSIRTCSTNYWSKLWPEFHFWNDTSASTGLVLRTYVWNNKSYQTVLDDNGHFAKKSAIRRFPVLFISPPNGQGYNKDWASAGPGAVYQWNPQTKAMQKSEQLTKKFIPAIPKKLGTVPEGPTHPGYFLDKNGTLYLFSK